MNIILDACAVIAYIRDETGVDLNWLRGAIEEQLDEKDIIASVKIE